MKKGETKEKSNALDPVRKTVFAKQQKKISMRKDAINSLGSFHLSRCSDSGSNPPTLIMRMRSQDMKTNKINQQSRKTGG